MIDTVLTRKGNLENFLFFSPMRLGNTFSTLLKYIFYYYAVVWKVWEKKNKIKLKRKREDE